MTRMLNLLYGYEFPPADPELARPVAAAPEPVGRAVVERVRPSGVDVVEDAAPAGRAGPVRLAVDLVAPGVFRVRARAGGAGGRRITLARPPGAPAPVDVEQGSGAVRLRGPDASAVIELDPLRLAFERGDGTVFLEQDRSSRNMPGVLSVLPLGCSDLEDGSRVFHDSFRCRPDERFYGFGERFGVFDKRGQVLRTWVDNPHGVSSERSYKCVPFFQSSRGYGVFVDSVTCCRFDVAALNHAAVGMVVPDRELDYYVIHGPEPQAVLRRYADLVGHPPVPPKWAFGLWVSGSSIRDSTELALARADGLRQRGIPADVLHIGHWQPDAAFSGLDWDEEMFPDPAAFIAQAHGRGFRVCLWISPYLVEGGRRFDEARDRGFLLRRPDGDPYVLGAMINFPPVGIIDVTNPEAATWWRERLRALLETGADAFKTDFAEAVPEDAVAHDGTTGAELHNLYPLRYTDLVAGVTADVTGRTGLVWGRSTHAGGQRHPAQWGGDPRCTWEDMASTLRGGLSLAMCGHPFWSHDMGGFKGRPDPVLFVRWSQFGLLSPLSRLHGTTSRLPWDYGDEAVDVVRAFARLRSALMPYLYGQAVEAAATSAPLLRPMAFQYPGDAAARSLDLQYMLGPDLLVAPVFDSDGDVEVYLPAGRWVDLWDRRAIDGPATLHLRVPLARVPIYVRGDALVPTAEPRERVEDGPFADVTVDGYLFGEGATDVRDVDGTTHVRARRDASLLAVDVEGRRRRLRFRLVPLAGTPAVEEVRVNGTAVRPGEGWRTTPDGGVVVEIDS